MSRPLSIDPGRALALCERCRGEVTETLAVIAHTGDRHEVLSPVDMLAVQAFDKGLQFHMKSGRVVYEALVLKDILAQYPGLFFRANRNWLVANDQVAAYNHDGQRGHYLSLVGSDLRVPVSRREWPAVAKRLGQGLRGPAPLTFDAARIARLHAWQGAAA